jgi:hypothetical protein
VVIDGAGRARKNCLHWKVRQKLVPSGRTEVFGRF